MLTMCTITYLPHGSFLLWNAADVLLLGCWGGMRTCTPSWLPAADYTFIAGSGQPSWPQTGTVTPASIGGSTSTASANASATATSSSG